MFEGRPPKPHGCEFDLSEIELLELTLRQYAVNRGSCNTRRIASRASLVIILYYLSSLAKTAASLLNQLVSAVAGLEVHVVTLQCQVTEHLSEKDLKETVKE